MSKVSASQGRSCRIWLELEPAIGEVVPDGFTYYIEWLGPDGEPEFILKTPEGGKQVKEGNRVSIDVDIPTETPTGLYDPTHFEMRYGAGEQREVREESVDEISLPSIMVTEAINPGIPWPKVKHSG